MPAIAFAAIPPFQIILSSKAFVPLWSKVEITWLNINFIVH